ncbi:hypothetical protein LSO9J_40019 [Candidatus Liberibacter solanacearum]
MVADNTAIVEVNPSFLISMFHLSRLRNSIVRVLIVVNKFKSILQF